MKLYIILRTLCFYSKPDSKILGGLNVKIASISEYECQKSLYSRVKTGPSSMGENVIASLVCFSFILVCFKYIS